MGVFAYFRATLFADPKFVENKPADLRIDTASGALWVRIFQGTAVQAAYMQLVDAAGDALAAALGATAPAGAVQVGGKDGGGHLQALALGAANQILGLPGALGQLA